MKLCENSDKTKNWKIIFEIKPKLRATFSSCVIKIKLFIIFSNHEGDMLVAKFLPSKQVAYVSYNGMEIPKYQFEVSSLNMMIAIYYSNGASQRGFVIF